MDKVKITSVNKLFLGVILLITVIPQVIIEVLYRLYGIDIGEIAKENQNVKNLFLIINQYIFILLPVVIFVIKNKLDTAKVLRLNPVGIPTFVLTVIIAAGAWVVSQYANLIVYHIYSEIFGEPKIDMVELIPADIALGFFLIAMTPAICEEVLFRGVILKAYENRGTMRAIFISAVLFALSHLYIIRITGPLIIGILAGYLVIKSNSIIPGILTHFTFNGISMLIFYSMKKLPEEVERFPTLAEYAVLSVFAGFGIIIMTLGIIAFNYFNSQSKRRETNNIILIYDSYHKERKQEESVFNKPVGTVWEDFISIITHWPIRVVLFIIILVNFLDLAVK